MSLRTFIENTPLGATILVSNDKPKPPTRFCRKLSQWETENYAGTLISIETVLGQLPAFVVREGAMDEKAPVIFQRRYTFDTSLRFEVQRRPTPGSVRIVRTSRRELLHIAGDHAAAVEWLSNNLISDAVAEVVTDDEATTEEEAA